MPDSVVFVDASQQGRRQNGALHEGVFLNKLQIAVVQIAHRTQTVQDRDIQGGDEIGVGHAGAQFLR